jgi:hypothetical protein
LLNDLGYAQLLIGGNLKKLVLFLLNQLYARFERFRDFIWLFDPHIGVVLYGYSELRVNLWHIVYRIR